MLEQTGDLWTLHAGARCITTNGMVRRDGQAVMGAGVALAAKQRYPDLPTILAKSLRRHGNHVAYLGYRDGAHLYSFPTKHDWRDPSDIDLIRRSAEELRDLVLPDLERLQPVLLPRPGCGNGQLAWHDVKAEIEGILVEDAFVIVSY